MEPLSTFGLVVNILQVIDFSATLIREAHEVHQSSTGQTVEHAELHTISQNLFQLCDGVPASLGNQLTSQFGPMSHQICEVAKGAKQVAEELMVAVDKLRLKEGPQRSWRSLRQALITLWNKDKIEKLQKRLGELRSQLQTNMTSHIL